ncbi:arylamine N-acetyltransferase [Hymenobacter sp. BT664]|uniref:Arylamine N-acetyltransferase n=1 Tax=Hymenobacter montanus TaxID=2771359 RepID=A0A927GIS1_9BACT|nr:arylamine N-acetyltransferase [Hymenobacter montanus]MBD2767712.1 arylamine N-acetyltransferase [Hymenobacter montanus]
MPDFAIDLTAYVARVGYQGPLTPSLETLVGLHRAQAFSIPFENLDIHLRRPIGLDPANLMQKLIGERRGGYCYEVNGLFRLVLQELGFPVTTLVGRNLIAGHPLRPRAHQVLRVEVAGQPWLIDLGFGNNGLIEPIPLVVGPDHRQGFDCYRLQAAPQHNYHLQLHLQGNWQSLYTFTLDEAQPSDFQMMNFFYSQSSDSPFRKQRICTLAGPDYRVSLVDQELKIRRPDGHIATSTLPDAAAYEQALETYFGIRLPAPLPAYS